jgi:hypothetical protein
LYGYLVQLWAKQFPFFVSEEEEEPEVDPYRDDEPAIAEYKRNHRNMRKNWDLPSSFPDYRVIEAYRRVELHVPLQNTDT